MIGVGSKVVCLRTPAGIGRLRGDPLGYPNGKPMKGNVYVVSALGLHPHDGVLHLRLIGVPIVNLTTNHEIWHNASRFRELEHEKMRAELAYYKALPVHAPEPSLLP